MYIRRQTVFENEDFVLSLENINSLPFVHLVCNKFDKKIFKDIKERWSELLVTLYFDGYEEVYTYTKDLRIPNMLGGGEVVGEHNGFKVVRWGLN